MSVFDHESVTGDTDNPLNKIGVDVLWGMEYHNVTSLGFADAIADFVCEDIFSIMKIWLHTTTIDLMWLKQEDVDDRKDGEGYYDSLEKIEEE